MPIPFFVSIYKKFILHLCNFYKNLLFFLGKRTILSSPVKKGGTCLTYENARWLGDVDDMIFDHTTVIPSQR